MRTINSSKQFAEKLDKFKKTSTDNKKRLWCCVRDYKKGIFQRIFNKAIKEAFPNEATDLIRIWNNLPMDHIELPGDVWNNSPLFRDRLFADVLNISSLLESWRMPRIIRELYRELSSSKNADAFYPEQFDITFDFVPRMCSKKLCNVCPFGKNGADSICIPTSNKYCPVALVTCGYVAKCVGEHGDCAIREELGKKICQETLPNVTLQL